LLWAVESERRRSRWWLWGAAALAAAAAVIATALLGTAMLRADDPRPTTTTAAAKQEQMTRVADIPIRATAALVDKSWGTEVNPRCTYTATVEGSYSLVLWAIDRSGRSEQIAVWEVISNGEARVVGSTSVHSVDLAALEVRTAKGNRSCGSTAEATCPGAMMAACGRLGTTAPGPRVRFSSLVSCPIRSR